MTKTFRKSHLTLLSAILISFTLTTLLPGCISKLWRGGDGPDKMQSMKKDTMSKETMKKGKMKKGY